MNAPLSNWSSENYDWNAINPVEWEALTDRGLEVEIEDISISREGLFEFKGKKVIVYIRDQYYYSRYGDSSYRYHLSDCSTLQSKRRSGRFNSRYVVTIRKDGKFLVNIKTERGWDKNILKEMLLCKNCWSILLSSGYNNIYKNKDWNKFDIKHYFEKYDSKINSLPVHSEKTMPINEYSNNQSNLSLIYRKNRNYKCENCRVDFSSDTKLLHLHHIDGDKSNNVSSNLIALCIVCHSKQPDHSHLSSDKNYSVCYRYGNSRRYNRNDQMR